MYKQATIPKVFSIPNLFGNRIDISIFPLKQRRKEKQESKIDYTDINQVLALVDKKEVAKMKKRLEPYRVDMSDFKFDRDEANNYDD
ncbi:hypothetical protein FACS189474_6100 [Bacteroidia bacterium]|nr:hypothetical protein FACS189474_6100 [Bacteroidia bacterium]